MPRLRSTVLAGIALLLTPLAARGTWSIVVYDSATGEVGVASATCIRGAPLKDMTGVLRVGLGAGAIQANGDLGAKYRKFIFKGLLEGRTAEEILAEIEADDSGFNGRQIGIVTADPSTVSHSGVSTINWTGGVVGTEGTLTYAIQGNIMACAKVVKRAEKALLGTRGDLSQRVMAAMWAAREFGGDWRCSCITEDDEAPGGAAFGCGCPPDDMLRASSTAYMVIARIGDTDGVCNGAAGCLNGDYWLDLEAPQWDPVGSVPFLQEHFEAFRQSWRGHADHLRSKKTVPGDPLPADGVSRTSLELTLVDIHDNPVPFGGARVTVQHARGSDGRATVGAVTDHGDGTYSVGLTAGSAPGRDVFEVVVEDGMGPVTLYPFPTLEHATPALTAEGGVGGPLSAEPTLLLDGGLEHAGRAWVLVGAYDAGLGGAPGHGFPLASGAFDAAGRARTALGGLEVPPGATGSLRVAWTALGPADTASNVVTFAVE